MIHTIKEVQQAGVRVITDAELAFARGEISDGLALVFRLTAIALMLKPAHQPGAIKIVKECAYVLGIDFEMVLEQVGARIYEHVELARIVEGGDHG